jgi:hypothetical protein
VFPAVYRYLWVCDSLPVCLAGAKYAPRMRGATGNMRSSCMFLRVATAVIAKRPTERPNWTVHNWVSYDCFDCVSTSAKTIGSCAVRLLSRFGRCVSLPPVPPHHTILVWCGAAVDWTFLLTSAQMSKNELDARSDSTTTKSVKSGKERAPNQRARCNSIIKVCIDDDDMECRRHGDGCRCVLLLFVVCCCSGW